MLSILFEVSSKQPAFFEKSCIYRRDDDGGLGVGALGRVRVGGAGVWIFAPLRLANHQIPVPTIAIVIIRDKIKIGALSFWDITVKFEILAIDKLYLVNQLKLIYIPETEGNCSQISSPVPKSVNWRTSGSWNAKTISSLGTPNSTSWLAIPTSVPSC